MSPLAPDMLLSADAMRSLPVFAIDLVAGCYLLLVWWRAEPSRRADLGALPLALYFLALASLAHAQVMMTSVLDVRMSFWWNHAGQSISVALSVPPLVRFSYRYVQRPFDREARLVEPIVLVLSLVVAAAFLLDTARTEDFIWDPALSHARKPPQEERLWSSLIAAHVFAGYVLSLVVLFRKARGLVGTARFRVLAFSVVVCVAVGAVVLFQLEANGLLPTGIYTTYMVWVTLGSILLFMASTDEITSFRERTVALVLVAELAVLAPIMQRSVERVALHGAHDGLTGLALRQLMHEAAVPFAWALVLCILLTLAVTPWLAEASVLGPLRALTRAQEQSRAKSMFLAQMSHDLRTPLHTILHEARTSTDRVHAPRIQRAADELLALIEELLLAGRGELIGLRARPAPCALEPLVRDVVEAQRGAAEARGLALSLTVDASVPASATLDASLLSRALANLVANAIKYTDRGSVQVSVRRDGERLLCAVVDTGRGIPREQQALVFQPFVQHDGREGVGLGLTIVREIADALDAELALDSAPGRGTQVELRVPLVAPTNSAVSAPASFELPDPDARAELLALARMGDVVALRERARALAAVRAELAPFCAHVEQLAATYQVRALRRLLGEDRSPGPEEHA